MRYRLYEDHGCVAPCPAFAESGDFDALRLWAVDHNDWKGARKVAVIASDAGRFWLIRRDGSVLREVSNVRGQTEGDRRQGSSRSGLMAPIPSRRRAPRILAMNCRLT